MAEEQSGEGHQEHEGRRSGRGISRRGLLIGGAVVAGTGALVYREEVSRLWWRVPGIDKQRNDGEVDHRGAQWIAASEANLRYADRPADFTVDRVVVHVT